MFPTLLQIHKRSKILNDAQLWCAHTNCFLHKLNSTNIYMSTKSKYHNWPNTQSYTFIYFNPDRYTTQKQQSQKHTHCEIKELVLWSVLWPSKGKNEVFIVNKWKCFYDYRLHKHRWKHPRFTLTRRLPNLSPLNKSVRICAWIAHRFHQKTNIRASRVSKATHPPCSEKSGGWWETPVSRSTKRMKVVHSRDVTEPK